MKGSELQAKLKALRLGGMLHTLDLRRQPVVCALCFVDAEWPLFGAAHEFEGVRIEDPRSLRRLITRPGRLTLEEVVEVAAVLAHALPPYTPIAADPPPSNGAIPD